MGDAEYAVQKSDEEWQAQLEPNVYRVLRRGATEPAGAGKFNSFFPKKGYFACGGCAQPVYSADSKFTDCGWIAFDKCYYSADKKCHVNVSPDGGSLETLCSNCGGHLGHVFYDGGGRTPERH
jgi:peptide-methionine (R)-S-oxide reductase